MTINILLKLYQNCWDEINSTEREDSQLKRTRFETSHKIICLFFNLEWVKCIIESIIFQPDGLHAIHFLKVTDHLFHSKLAGGFLPFEDGKRNNNLTTCRSPFLNKCQYECKRESSVIILFSILAEVRWRVLVLEVLSVSSTSHVSFTKDRKWRHHRTITTLPHDVKIKGEIIHMAGFFQFLFTKSTQVLVCWD